MLIVIDGLDGSGKSTQFEIIKNKLSEKRSVKSVSFPDYSEPSSALVKMYLAGEISHNAADVNAYAASCFYAADRYVSYKKFWESEYNSGNVILASRYTTSNAIHQMSKLPENEWDSFLSWLEDFEYVKLGLPKPDCVIFLDMPVEVSQKLLNSRYRGDENKKDIHESNVEYLEECRRSALYAAERLGWSVIKCSVNGSALTIDEITEELLKVIEKVL